MREKNIQKAKEARIKAIERAKPKDFYKLNPREQVVILRQIESDYDSEHGKIIDPSLQALATRGQDRVEEP